MIRGPFLYSSGRYGYNMAFREAFESIFPDLESVSSPGRGYIISVDHIKYRPDIDGLRAIAILAVLGFHAHPGSVTGGFVGVDVFFVISGYLISTIIFRQLEKNSFSLKQFYFRRIKRIFPALMLLMIASCAFGWYVLLPDEFRMLGKHIAGGNAFISNLVLWGEAGYFDTASESKTLLHLWSLGIEEQFYILWPISLWFVWKRKINFLAATIVIALASFGANLYALENQTAAAAFYMPTNRFWELMIGGILSYVTLHKPGWRPRGRVWSNFQSFIGLGMIVAASMSLHRGNTFPGWWALLPTIGTYFLISTPGALINRFLLGNRLMVYIGLISYPLYLWHWPILSYAHILEFTEPWHMNVGLGLSFLLAILTFELVEKKIRPFQGPRLIYGLVLVSVVLIGVGLSFYQGLVKPRNDSAAIQMAMDAVNDWEYPKGLTAADVNGIKVYTKTGAPEKVLFYGDSHVEQYSPRIVKLIDDDPTNTRSAVFATSGGCPPIPNVYEDRHPACNPEFREKILAYALSDEIEAIVIGASWGNLINKGKPPEGKYRYYFQDGEEKVFFDEGGIELAYQSLEEFLGLLAGQKKVYLIIDNPIGVANNPKNHFLGDRLTGFVANDTRFQPYDEAAAIVRNRMLAMAERTGALIIDPVLFLCEDGQCRTTMEDGKPIYKDGSHIRPFFVRDHMDILDVTVKK